MRCIMIIIIIFLYYNNEIASYMFSSMSSIEAL